MGRILPTKKSKLSLKVVYCIAKLPLYISLISVPLHINYTRVTVTFVSVLFLSVCPHQRSGQVTEVGQSIPSLWTLSWSEGGHVTKYPCLCSLKIGSDASNGVALLPTGSLAARIVQASLTMWRKPCQRIQ